jgi:hypothetical protein
MLTFFAAHYEEERKQFFFEKRTKKLLILGAAPVGPAQLPWIKAFCFFFSLLSGSLTRIDQELTDT